MTRIGTEARRESSGSYARFKSFPLRPIKSLELVNDLEILELQTRTRQKRSFQKMEDQMPASKKQLGRSYRSQGNGHYVAISYPWEPSEGEREDPSKGAWEVETRGGGRYKPSDVRNVVFDRVEIYARARNVNNIWIDRECVPQNEGNQLKDRLIQSMDLVYKFAEHSVALLVKPIRSQKELDLFWEFHSGQILDVETGEFLREVEEGELHEVLDLLDHITSDRWWSRAWTFQEAYCAGKNMDLLIPYECKKLKKRGNMDSPPSCGGFGDIKGQLIVYLIHFRSLTTRFCLSVLSWLTADSAIERKRDRILSRAGQYKILLEKDLDGNRTAMTWRIFQDLGKKDITKEWDFLAIVANCCGFDFRLNPEKLEKNRYVMSQCIMALYFLNGEIFEDTGDGHAGSRDWTNIQQCVHYLERISLKRLRTPVPSYQLTFLKRVRLVKPILSDRGVTTTGLLWNLGDPIELPQQPFHDLLRRYQSDKTDRQILIRLAGVLREHPGLSQCLFDYANQAFRRNEGGSLSLEYMEIMAERILDAIENRKLLQLACIRNPGHSPYRAIFIVDAENDEPLSTRDSSRLVFTAWQTTSGDRRIALEENEHERFVSLEVDLVDDTEDGPPVVSARRWLDGLFFSYGVPGIDVTFQWPRSLR